MDNNGALSIMVVAPGKEDCEFYRSALASVQASVVLHSNVSQALKDAAEHSHSLYIVDIKPKSPSESDLCPRLRVVSRNPGAPIIMVSDFGSEVEIDSAFARGASAFIPRLDVKSKLSEKVLHLLKQYHFKRDQVILVVDDSEPTSKLIKGFLSKAGFKVITASDGLEALMILEIKKVHLVLSDIEMPVMDGLMLYKEILKKDNLKQTPFLAMSGTFGHGRMKRMVEMGCAGYIIKPFDSDYLVSMIERILSDNYLLLLKDREMLTKERKTFIGIIASLVSALEAKDPYTRGHSRNVSMMMVRFARYIQVNSQDLDLYRISGELHDIGKIGIPDQILLKKGPLSREEFEEIKKHPILGEKIISSVPSLNEAAEIILYHHERYDGKGYPSGLAGEDIPFISRLLAVADAYDALTSDRPYRKGMKENEALNVIIKESSFQFCPEAVSILKKIVQKKSIPAEEVLSVDT